MFGETRYISWAWKHFGKVDFDLASSGIPSASFAELGVAMPSIDDVGAYARFRESIARYNDVPVDDVVPALGTSQAIFFAYAATLSAGDEILVEHPGYEPLVRAAEGLGVKVNRFERPEPEGFAVATERVAAKMTPRTRLIVVSNLHNPSGARLPDEVVTELATIADARGAFVLVDEVYAPFDDLPEDGIFRRSARKLAPNVLAIGSLTKCYGVGMYRVGWLLAPPAIAAEASHATVATTGHLPLAHAALGEAAFSALPRLARRAKGLLDGKRALVAEWTKAMPNARWSAPESGLYGMLTFPGRGDLLDAIEACARETGVLVSAGTFFGAPNALRLSWATCDRARLAEGLHRLSRFFR